MSHLFKVWDSQRENRVIILIKDGANIYEQLIVKASEKLQTNGVKLVLEKDGSLIDEDEILILLKDEIFMLLEQNDKWRSEGDGDDRTSRASTLTLNTESSNAGSIVLDNTTLLDESVPIFINESTRGLVFNENTFGQTIGQNIIIETIPAFDPTEKESEASVPAIKDQLIDANLKQDSNVIKTPPMSQVNYEAWNNFNIPWNRMPMFVIEGLKKNEKHNTIEKHVVQVIIDEMRTITPNISINACRIVAAKVIQKYPDIFKDKDKNGVTIGNGDHGLVSKLLDRNNYLNRPHKRSLDGSSERQKIPRKKNRQLVNSRSGCARNWQPDNASQSMDAQEYLKENQDPSDNIFWQKLDESFPQQRTFINNIDKPPTVKEILAEWPVLFKKQVIWWHFEKVTGCNIKNVLKDLPGKVKLVLNVSKGKPSLKNPVNEEFISSLQIAADNFKEDLSVFLNIFEKDVETMKPKTVFPSIVKCDEYGQEKNNENLLIIIMEGEVILKGSLSMEEAVVTAFCIYFILNLQYPMEVSSLMEFIQRFFFGIHLDTGTRSKKKNTKNKVINYINKICK